MTRISAPARERDRCRAAVIFPTPRTFPSPAWSKTQPTTNSRAPIPLRELFNAAGVKHGDSVTTYCHIGQQASLLSFAARYLGYDAHVYDGSFEDWSRRPELPVVKSDAEKTDPKP